MVRAPRRRWLLAGYFTAVAAVAVALDAVGVPTLTDKARGLVIYALILGALLVEWLATGTPSMTAGHRVLVAAAALGGALVVFLLS